jgi:Ca-activated chloride channel homolog
MRRVSWFAAVLVLSALAAGLSSPSARAQTSSSQSLAPPTKTPPVPDKKTPVAKITLEFAYGSEKKNWIDAVTAKFNGSDFKVASGEQIVVKTVAAGSGEIIDDLLSEKSKAHVVSPAAGAFVEIGNAASSEQNKGDLIGETKDLVRSPIVVMIWSDTAKKLGWPAKSIKWSELFSYASDTATWAAVAPGSPPFKLAHTQPDQSNSGLHAIFLQAFAGAKKFDGLTIGDVNTPEVKQYFTKVEAAVPYYETSTGFLAKRMVQEGPSVLTAAIVYENLVIEANRASANSGQPAQVVAIYPEEGTFPSEHPIGIVKRPWVTAKHEEAAGIYINYLRAKEQQEEAMKSGFRPYDPEMFSLADRWKAELGVSEKKPKDLEPPPYSAINLIRETWRETKNTAATSAKGQ